MKRLLALLLLLASPALGQVVFQDVSVRAINLDFAGGAPPNDCTGSFVSWWNMDQGDSATRTNDVGTTCGSDCNLINNVSVLQDTSNYVEGSASADFQRADSDHLNCNAVSTVCEELWIGPDVTFGGWVRPEAENVQYNIADYESATKGHILQARGDVAGDPFRLGIADGSDLVEVDGTTDFAADTWYYVVGRANSTTDTITINVNGSDENSTTQQDMATYASNPIYSHSGGNALEGQLDSQWVYDGVLTEAWIAHFGACEPDGSDCLCSGATYTDEGKVDANCTGVGTPYDCCTGSGTGCIDDAELTGNCNATCP